jgi:hypothetical protein
LLCLNAHALVRISPGSVIRILHYRNGQMRYFLSVASFAALAFVSDDKRPPLIVVDSFTCKTGIHRNIVSYYK